MALHLLGSVSEIHPGYKAESDRYYYYIKVLT